MKEMEKGCAIGRWTRRGFLGSMVASGAGAWSRAERVRYLDPATEFEVSRVTNTEFASYLPPPGNRIFTRRGNLMLYASERENGLQAFTLDLRSWQSHAVTQAAALERETLSLTPDDRNICYVDGGTVMIAGTGGGRGRPIYGLSTPSRPAVMSVTPQGPSVLVVEDDRRLRMAPLYKGSPLTLAENADGIVDPQQRPRRASVQYRTRRDEIWLAHLDGTRQVRLKTAAPAGPAMWAPDGRTILYLHTPEGVNQVTELREHTPDTGEDRKVAPTSQFASIAANADASVFVGASRSKAGPYVLLLLRSVRRELALCEHKASDASAVNAVFTPDSQKVFFQSDRAGKSAIYMMVVDRLVEKTEEEPQVLSR